MTSASDRALSREEQDKSSIKHRRGRSSIDKSQVSKPFPILAYDETRLFDAMASGNLQARERRVPKVVEKKVKIVIPEPLQFSPRHKPKASSDPPSRSWYTPTKVQPLPKSPLQRHTSSATPRFAPSKVDLGRTNSAKGFKHPRSKPLPKPAEDTLHPTIFLVSKPLPDLPAVDSLASRWSASTGSIYSNEDSFSVLDSFPNPPNNTPQELGESVMKSKFLNRSPTPMVLMSCPNTSSGSVATILPDPPALKPLRLKTAPKPKIATVVHQDPHSSCSLSLLPDSIAVQGGRTPPKIPSDCEKLPTPVLTVEALVFPHLRQDPEELERVERARLERKKKYDLEREKEREMELFKKDFGLNPFYRGEKKILDPEGFKLIVPENKPRKWF